MMAGIGRNDHRREKKVEILSVPRAEIGRGAPSRRG
jgi:hypothetical protein